MQGINIQIPITQEIINEIASAVVEMIDSKKQIEPKAKFTKTYFTVKEASEYSGKSKQLLTAHIRIGMLIASKSGKSYSILKDNLDNYLQNI